MDLQQLGKETNDKIQAEIEEKLGPEILQIMIKHGDFLEACSKGLTEEEWGNCSRPTTFHFGLWNLQHKVVVG